MFTCKPGRVTYFDVDGTLLEWPICEENDEGAVKVENNGHIFYKKAIPANVAALIEHSYAGHVIVVWSKGGVEWATTVVKALNLEDNVDIILTKPDWFYDDEDPEHWLPERQFRTRLL